MPLWQAIGLALFLFYFYIYVFRLTCLFSFQIELEKLNSATDEINKLEIELDVSISVN